MTITNNWLWVCEICGAKEVVQSEHHRPSLWKIVRLVYDENVEGEKHVICKSCFGASGAVQKLKREELLCWLMQQWRKLRWIREPKKGNKVPRR